MAKVQNKLICCEAKKYLAKLKWNWAQVDKIEFINWADFDLRSNLKFSPSLCLCILSSLWNKQPMTVASRALLTHMQTQHDIEKAHCHKLWGKKCNNQPKMLRCSWNAARDWIVSSHSPYFIYVPCLITDQALENISLERWNKLYSERDYIVRIPYKNASETWNMLATKFRHLAENQFPLRI